MRSDSIALVFVVLGVLVDWARVGTGIHHVIDVAGSAAFVAVGLTVGYLIAPYIMRVLLPHIPAPLLLSNDQEGEQVGSNAP